MLLGAVPPVQLLPLVLAMGLPAATFPTLPPQQLVKRLQVQMQHGTANREHVCMRQGAAADAMLSASLELPTHPDGV
jgi:hypothetical protein